MTVFADSSAVVKLYVEEADHERVQDLESVVVSAICQVEVSAAIWRKARISEIEEAEAALLVRQFELDLADVPGGRVRFAAIPVTSALLAKAARLVPILGLRSLDAIQLASALTAREVDESCGTFACFDRELCQAATAHGFRLLASS